MVRRDKKKICGICVHLCTKRKIHAYPPTHSPGRPRITDILEWPQSRDDPHIPAFGRSDVEVCERIVSESGLYPALRFDWVAWKGQRSLGGLLSRGLSTHPDLGIAVADNFQGQGIGTALLTRLMDWA